MKERKLLKDKILLAGEIEGQKFKRTFTIVRKISESGAMVVAYEAYHSGAGRGVLREFYPKDNIILDRDTNGQLVITGDFEEASQRFIVDKKRYLDSYKRIQNIISGNNDNEFNKFLPIFEIYYGCDEDLNEVGTVYIWTPEPKLQSYDKVCEENRRHPKVSPEFKLVSALKAIETLTEAVMDLHMAGFIHRDIKPSNFGFQMFHNKISTENFKIFDLDSIIPVISRRVLYSVVSEGFTEPEATLARPSAQTDIYSIGATLFTAIVVTPETIENGVGFRSEYYDRLDQMVSESMIISSGEINSNPRLRYKLTDILKKCLAPRSERYQRCEDLLKDVEDALFYALPAEITRRNKSSEKWILTTGDVKTTLDKVHSNDINWPFINHLYDVPFYRYSNSEVIDILVIGFDSYSQKYVDLILQTGHISGRRIRLTIVTEDEFEERIYLEERPELKNFFNINGKQNDNSYGDIIFDREVKTSDFKDKSRKDLKEYCSDYLNAEDKNYTYVFVSVSDDAINYQIAKSMHEASSKNTQKSVTYILELEDKADTVDDLYAIFVGACKKKYKHSDEIERMAFNFHLIWEKNLNLEMSKIRKDYLDSYNHYSCLCAVLSLKYKLYGIGFDMDVMPLSQIASKYNPMDYYQDLTFLEHRRWVSEKICSGWTRRSVKDSVSGITRDRKLKNHICILESSKNTLLKDKYTARGLETWDNMTSEQMTELDDLDRMSVELHKAYQASFTELKESNQMSITSIQNGIHYSAIYHLVEEDKVSLQEFLEWVSLIKEIYNDSPSSASSKLKRYRGLKNAFINSAKDRFSDRIFEEILLHVEAFDKYLKPLLLSREYHDYKQADSDIIEDVPFILTYNTRKSLIIPFELGTTGSTFDNVSSPVVINPKSLTYLVLLNTKEEVDMLSKGISIVTSYISKKRLQSSVDLLILYGNSIGAMVDYSYEQNLIKNSYGKIKSIKRVSFKDEATIIDALNSYLKSKAVSSNSSVLINESAVSSYLKKMPCFEKLGKYTFDSNSITFNSINNTEDFKYITKKPYYTVSEAMSFAGIEIPIKAKPELYNDYKDLWSEYKRKSASWKSLNETINSYFEAKDLYSSFKISSDIKCDTEYKYILPYYCSYNASKLISFFSESGIISDSLVTGFTSDSIAVSFMSAKKMAKTFNKFFSDNLLLGIRGNLILNTDGKEVRIYRNSLEVQGLKANKSEISLLKYFEKMGLITIFDASEGSVDLSIATSSIKAFLRDSNSMFRAYVYHSLKECSFVDDIVCNFKDEMEDGIFPDFDIIFTHGFKTYFIKCQDGSVSDSCVDEIRGINSEIIIIDESNVASVIQKLLAY